MNSAISANGEAAATQDPDAGPTAPGTDSGVPLAPAPDGDEPGSLYACAISPGGAAGRGSALVWLLAGLAAARISRRRGRRV